MSVWCAVHASQAGSTSHGRMRVSESVKKVCECVDQGYGATVVSESAI